MDLNLPKHDSEEIFEATPFDRSNPVVRAASRALRSTKRPESTLTVHYFRKPPRLSEYIQLNMIVGDALTLKTNVDEECMDRLEQGGEA